MLHILPAVMMRENNAQPSRKSLTPGDGSLMPPAIQSVRSTRSRKNQCFSFAPSRETGPG